MPDGGVETGSKSFQSVVVTVQVGCGRDKDGLSGGGTDRWGGEYIWNGDRDILSLWEDNVSKITLRTETNNSLA